MISYAQNFEDVMIARLFEPGYKGVYVDVGAADPVRLSVTKHFHDAGWRGVNVEPLPQFYDRLCADRPEDVNLNVAVGAQPGEVTFFEILELGENSTTDETVMRALTKDGSTAKPHRVDVLTLAQICERHCRGGPLDFLKIDVEGGELDVLRGADWERFRPVLVIVEAVEVNGTQEVWQSWEPVLTAARYEKVWFDGLNNFYLRAESRDLKVHFRLPPNVFDKFTVAPTVSFGENPGLAKVLEDRLALIERLSSDMAAAQASHAAEIEALQRACDERLDLIKRLEADHAAEADALRQACDERLAVIERMKADHATEIEAVQHVARLGSDLAVARAIHAAESQTLRQIQHLSSELATAQAAGAAETEALQGTCEERLDLINRLAKDHSAEADALQRVCEERLDLIERMGAEIEMLRRTCDERLELIERMQTQAAA